MRDTLTTRPDTPDLEDAATFGARFGASTKTVNRWVRDGDLVAGVYRIGRYNYFDPAVALAALRLDHDDA
jgi:predicted site-specific integrase-resolvase